MELDGYIVRIGGCNYSLHDILDLMACFEAGECQNKHEVILVEHLHHDLLKIGFTKESAIGSYSYGRDNVCVCPGHSYQRFKHIVIKHWLKLEKETNPQPAQVE